MFLRQKCRHKDGKPHYYWEIVESYRTERGPRQRVVAHLGEMTESERLGIHHAAQGHPPIQESLWDDPRPEWVEVDRRKVRLERSRRFGDVSLALELLKRLHLTKLFEEILPDTHAKISWSVLAEVLVVARFPARTCPTSSFRRARSGLVRTIE